jgi:hypothetical protein
MSELIDISQVDAMALSLRDVVKYLPPDGIEVIDPMAELLELEARATILGGVAVDPCMAVGLEDPKQVKPSQIFSDGEAGFVGRFTGVELVDFTPAVERDGMLAKSLKSGDEVIAHGLVFKTDPRLSDIFEGNLGVASLMPYVAVLPGSLYAITRLAL